MIFNKLMTQASCVTSDFVKTAILSVHSISKICPDLTGHELHTYSNTLKICLFV